MAKHPTEKSATPHEKITFTVEAYIPGESVREKLEWLQKNFDYFHPTFQAKVVYNGEVMIGREPVTQTKPVQTIVVQSFSELYPDPDPLSLV